MKRTKLDDRVLPERTKTEEILSMVLNIIGGLLSIALIVLSCVFGAVRHNVFGIVSGSVFGTCMLLYCVFSSIYHGLSVNCKAKKVFQIFDICLSFILLAGSFVPIALCTLRSYSALVGWSVFGIAWFITSIGIVLNAIDIDRYKIITLIIYFVPSWLLLIGYKILLEWLTIPGFILLVAGGIVYTVGGIIYLFTKKYKFMHCLLHLFIITGTTLHGICTLLFII